MSESEHSVSGNSETIFILLKINPDGKVEVTPIADNEKSYLKALTRWQELMPCQTAK
ncbi:MAG TPA: hypothetical protein GXX21_10340 [Syntrophomonadaceae bacterium]|jgi:hypothetical protein|nr:hypothetical protein [Thermoanaerobacterales bacterium]HHW29931.1 hypothetical protein [Syntrophomonadaceae bacterium]